MASWHLKKHRDANAADVAGRHPQRAHQRLRLGGDVCGAVNEAAQLQHEQQCQSQKRFILSCEHAGSLDRPVI